MSFEIVSDASVTFPVDELYVKDELAARIVDVPD